MKRRGRPNNRSRDRAEHRIKRLTCAVCGGTFIAARVVTLSASFDHSVGNGRIGRELCNHSSRTLLLRRNGTIKIVGRNYKNCNLCDLMGSCALVESRRNA